MSTECQPSADRLCRPTRYWPKINMIQKLSVDWWRNYFIATCNYRLQSRERSWLGNAVRSKYGDAAKMIFGKPDNDKEKFPLRTERRCLAPSHFRPHRQKHVHCAWKDTAKDKIRRGQLIAVVFWRYYWINESYVTVIKEKSCWCDMCYEF